jgi:hypothetical protein
LNKTNLENASFMSTALLLDKKSSLSASKKPLTTVTQQPKIPFESN